MAVKDGVGCARENGNEESKKILNIVLGLPTTCEIGAEIVPISITWVSARFVVESNPWRLIDKRGGFVASFVETARLD